MPVSMIGHLHNWSFIYIHSFDLCYIDWIPYTSLFPSVWTFFFYFI